MVGTRHLTVIAASLSLLAQSALACSPSPQDVEEAPLRAATRGYFVKARVVRGYDARNRLPETLEIQKIFVGKDIPRTVVLERDSRFFEARAKGFGDPCSVEFSTAQPKAALYILYPSPSGKLDVFVLDGLFSVSIDGRGLDRMLAEAKRNGRLRGRPLPEDF